MSHYYAQQHQQARPRPEPLALGGQQHAPPALDQHRANLLSSLRSAPLPHQNQNHNQWNHSPYQAQQYQQAPINTHFSSHNPATAAAFGPAAAEFQHAQTAYLAELAGLQRTIEQQIVAQQQLERDAAYRLLAAQRQGQGQASASPAQYANYAPAPHQMQQQQGSYSAGPQGGRGFAQQQFVPAAAAGPANAGGHEAQNPLVASALARRQRQEQAQFVQPQQGQGQGQGQAQRARGGSSSPHGRGPAPPRAGQSHSQPQSRSASQHRSTPPPLYGQQQRSSPPPPALILSAPGEAYPDTSSGSESGETRPSSPDASLDTAKRHQQQGVKASRRRSHLDALVGLGHAVEQRKGGAPGIAIASRARPASSSFAPPPPPPGDFYGGQFVPAPAHGHRSVSDSHAVLSPHASSYAPAPAPAPASPSPAPTPRYAPPPVPGTAYAVRQPRIPPTDLSPETNWALRKRSRAIESIRARGARSGGGAPGEGVQGLVPSLATVQIGA
ncbi:hypothetical protein JCM9279_002265 [Rhodotorula babjevae]